MYLKNIVIHNNGPIEKLEIFEKNLFKEDGNPKILILTGKNGSGKTIFLSNLTDAFFELANQNFNDILPSQGLGHSYYRVVGGSNQKIGSKYSFSFLNFEGKYNVKAGENKEKTGENKEKTGENKEEAGEEIIKKYQYLEKTGELTFIETQEKTNNLFTENNNWEEGKIITNVESDKNIKDDFLQNTYCFFPVSRFENPHWLNEWKNEDREQIKISKKYNGELNKPIIIENSLSENKIWILDLFLDYLTDYTENLPGEFNAPNIHRKNFLKQSKNNIEIILSKILQKDLKNENGEYKKDNKLNNLHGIEIQLNLRNNLGNRLKLIDKETGLNFVPSLDNLSGGQNLLLNLFASIIRLSDLGDINKSINLDQIEGIVLIDEIDLSLHIDLQKEVLPELLSIFPKIQFIITSHSPFFLLGMEEKANKDSNFQYQIIRMPEGIIDNNIKGIEEVGKAYSIFEENFEDFKKEFYDLNKKIQEQNKTLIITEGKTDWKHLKNSLSKISGFENLKDNIFFHECEENNGKINGSSGLKSFLEHIGNIGSQYKIIGIFDRDEPSIIKLHEDENEQVKIWGKNIFSICIPLPKNRTIGDKISIEHYYSDNEIKTFDGNNRRIFLLNEFQDSHNILKSIDGNYWCKKIDLLKTDNYIKTILTGDTKKCDKIYKIEDTKGETNIALSKNDFAENILKGEELFNNFNLDNFKPLFEKIKIIIGT